ncbi:hypothetical protein C8R46DRAFT_1208309 [Mycena filopes]|nr:hypothetical protein C8R46DRAFT_1208309 [Mycena filopes]
MADILRLQRGRVVIRPPPPTRPVPLAIPPLLQPLESDSRSSSEAPSSSPPRLAPVIDFDEYDSLVDVSQLVDDVANGKFQHPSSPPQVVHGPEPYTTPTWFPALIQHMLALSIPQAPTTLNTSPTTPQPPPQINVENCLLLGVYTRTISRAIVYTPQELHQFNLSQSSLTMGQVIDTLLKHDSKVGGYLLRQLPQMSPPCVVGSAAELELPVLYERPSTQSTHFFPLNECFSPDSSLGLPHRALFHLYSVLVSQEPLTLSYDSAESFLTAHYMYERHLLSGLPTAGYGVAYLHYARYCILSRIATELGLHINKPSEASTIAPVQAARISHGTLFAWAGVHVLRTDLLSRTQRSLPEDRVLAHLYALAQDPVAGERPSSYTCSGSMTTKDVSAALAASGYVAQGPITHEFAAISDASTTTNDVDAILAAHGGVAQGPIGHEYAVVRKLGSDDSTTTNDVDAGLAVHGGLV